METTDDGRHGAAIIYIEKGCDMGNGSPDAIVVEVARLLRGWGAGFAYACRENSTKPNDEDRRPDLTIGKGGLQQDEARAFLRGFEHGLVVVDPDGRFRLPGAGNCSSNLHLIGRNGHKVRAHMEYLIHIGAYAELVLCYGWPRDRISFECGSLDIWGHRSDGKVVLAVEAKARVNGSDSLESLLASLNTQPVGTQVARGKRNHDLKKIELLRLTSERPVLLWLVADGARWLFRVVQKLGSLSLAEVPEVRSTLVDAAND